MLRVFESYLDGNQNVLTGESVFVRTAFPAEKENDHAKHGGGV